MARGGIVNFQAGPDGKPVKVYAQLAGDLDGFLRLGKHLQARRENYSGQDDALDHVFHLSLEYQKEGAPNPCIEVGVCLVVGQDAEQIKKEIVDLVAPFIITVLTTTTVVNVAPATLQPTES